MTVDSVEAGFRVSAGWAGHEFGKVYSPSAVDEVCTRRRHFAEKAELVTLIAHLKPVCVLALDQHKGRIGIPVGDIAMFDNTDGGQVGIDARAGIFAKVPAKKK